MIYLLLAILGSTFVSIMIRTSNKYSQYNYGLLAINYVTCILLASQGKLSTLTIPIDLPITLSLAILSGILYMISFMVLQLNINKNGLVYSSLFSKLGVIVPLIVSILFFHESPTLYSLLGVILALAGIIYMNHSDSSIADLTGLIALLIIGGMTDVQSKIFSEIGNIANNDQYLFYTFVFALVTSLIFLIIKKQRIKKGEIIFGILVGIPNYMSARFLLKSLNTLDGIIVYPLYSIGTILTISLLGVLLFKEKISKRSLKAMIMMLIAIVLLNI